MRNRILDRREVLGNGFVSEAGELLIQRVFEDFVMHVIWANYFAGNEKSKRDQEKLGFEYYKTIENKRIKLIDKITDLHFTKFSKERYLYIKNKVRD